MVKKKGVGIEMIALGIILLYLIINSQGSFLGGVWQSRSLSSIRATCDAQYDHGKIYKKTVYYGPCLKLIDYHVHQYDLYGQLDYVSGTEDPVVFSDVLGENETDTIEALPIEDLNRSLFEEVDTELLEMNETEIEQLHLMLDSQYPSDPSTMVFAVTPTVGAHLAHHYYRRCGSRTYYCLVTPPDTVSSCSGSGWRFKEDCGVYCGNGICDGEETYEFCPEDCECEVLYWITEGCEDTGWLPNASELCINDTVDQYNNCNETRTINGTKDCDALIDTCEACDLCGVMSWQGELPRGVCIENGQCEEMGPCWFDYIGIDIIGVCRPDMTVCNDTDGDSIPDHDDNCPWLNNPGQEDVDGDGIGDVCDGSYEPDAACLPGDTQPCQAANGCDGRMECVEGTWTTCHSQFSKCVDGQCRLNCAEGFTEIKCKAWQKYNLETGKCELNALFAFLLVPVRRWVKRKFNVSWL